MPKDGETVVAVQDAEASYCIHKRGPDSSGRALSTALKTSGYFQLRPEHRWAQSGLFPNFEEMIPDIDHHDIKCLIMANVQKNHIDTEARQRTEAQGPMGLHEALRP